MNDETAREAKVKFLHAEWFYARFCSRSNAFKNGPQKRGPINIFYEC